MGGHGPGGGEASAKGSSSRGCEATSSTSHHCPSSTNICCTGHGVCCTGHGDICTRICCTGSRAICTNMQHRPLSQHQQALALQCWPLRQLEAMEHQPLEPATEPSSERVLIV